MSAAPVNSAPNDPASTVPNARSRFTVSWRYSVSGVGEHRRADPVRGGGDHLRNLGQGAPHRGRVEQVKRRGQGGRFGGVQWPVQDQFQQRPDHGLLPSLAVGLQLRPSRPR